MPYSDLTDDKLAKLIDNRWDSSSSLWDEVKRVTDKNKRVYEGKPEWWTRARIPPTRPKVTTNRVFTDTEAVINSLIANPPKPNIIPSRDSDASKEFAAHLEKYLNVKYAQLNVKEVLRQCLRDLFFSRIMVMKPYWDGAKNDVSVRRVDPNKVRFSSIAKNEQESEFAIEEIDSTVLRLADMYPEQRAKILSAANVTEEQALIDDPKATYREAWVGTELFVKFKGLILYKGPNPYWDWDGLLATREELVTLSSDDGAKLGDKLRAMASARMADVAELPEGTDPMLTVQDARRKEAEKDGVSYEAYLFNYFDRPRKPYIFATVLGNEDRPVGLTSFIEQATSLQEVVDRIAYQIYLNTEMVNGITKVDSQLTNVSKADAQNLRYDSGGVIWGKGVVQGVEREFGQGLPAFVFEAMREYLNEIDNVMAASSAFRGEREGQETKAGRLALIEQSFLRLNELVQTVDYVMQELFGWWMQLMKARYTERHMVKELGPDQAVEAYELTRDDIEDGIEVRVIPGKTLPEDRQFMFDRAQQDFKAGLLSPIDYMTEAGYPNPKELARNAFEFAQNPAGVLGVEQAVPGVPAQPEAVAPQEAEIPIGG